MRLKIAGITQGERTSRVRSKEQHERVTKHDGRETGGQGKGIICVQYLGKSSDVALDIERQRRLLLAFPALASDIIIEIEL